VIPVQGNDHVALCVEQSRFVSSAIASHIFLDHRCTPSASDPRCPIGRVIVHHYDLIHELRDPIQYFSDTLLLIETWDYHCDLDIVVHLGFFLACSACFTQAPQKTPDMGGVFTIGLESQSPVKVAPCPNCVPCFLIQEA